MALGIDDSAKDNYAELTKLQTKKAQDNIENFTRKSERKIIIKVNNASNTYISNHKVIQR